MTITRPRAFHALLVSTLFLAAFAPLAGAEISDPLPPGVVARLGTYRIPGRFKALSADGRIVVSVAENDSTLDFWDTKTGRKISSVQRKGDLRFTSFALAPDGATAALATEEKDRGGIEIIDVASGKGSEVDWKAPEKAACSFTFSPDGKLLALAVQRQETEVLVLDAATGKQLPPFAGKFAEFRHLAFSPDGKHLTAATTSGAALWEVATRKIKQQLPPERGRILFGPEGKLLACALDETTGAVRLTDAATGKELFTLQAHARRLLEIKTSADGQWLAVTGAEDEISVWDLGNGKRARSFPGSRRGLDWTFTADGRTLVVPEQDAEHGSHYLIAVVFWDVATGKERTDRRQGHRHPIAAVTFQNGGNSLFSLDREFGRGVRHWDVTLGKEKPLPEWGEAKHFDLLTLSPDDSLLALCSISSRAISLRDPLTGKEVRSIQGHVYKTKGIAFAPDGKTLASVGHEQSAGKITNNRYISSLRLWDVATGKLQAQLAKTTVEEDRAFYGVFWLADGKHAAVADMAMEDGQTRLTLYDTTKDEAGRLLGRGMVPLAVSPDSRRMAAQSNNGIVLVQLPEGKKIAELPEGYNIAVFSPDGRCLATDGEDNTIILWEAATGKERARLVGHRESVTALAFSPDGKRLASGSDDTTVLVWDLTQTKGD